MSITYIPENIKTRLWGRAAGRCEYDGCNDPLWLDPVTKFEFNASYIAHIIADSPDGPRGHPTLSEELKASISNLMLMCDKHHRLVDKGDVQGHPVELLQAMKQSHEHRIEVLTDVSPEKQSHIVLYGANIGDLSSPVNYAKARMAMAPDWYPAETAPISLGMANTSYKDSTSEFWQFESTHLRNMFIQQIRPRISQGTITHLSVFALAPQPLLILLGSLLSDLHEVEVYQLRREPPDWRWRDHTEDTEYTVTEPAETSGPPALVVSLSATITDDRVSSVLGPGVAIWRLAIPAPHNDFLQSRHQARQFRETARRLLDRIKASHGEQARLHLFPAMPAALAVEFGRILTPKADLPLTIYDQNRSIGGFAPALDLGTE